LFAAGVSKEDVTLAPFPSSTPLRSLQLVWMDDRGSGPAHLVGRACQEIFMQVIIPQLRARAPGLEERVTLAT
jgi:hypothetical protein